MARLTLSIWLGGVAMAGLMAGPATRVMAGSPQDSMRQPYRRSASSCKRGPGLPASDPTQPPHPQPIDEPSEQPTVPSSPTARSSHEPPPEDTSTLPPERPQADRDSVREGARQFIDLIQQGRVQLMNALRDRSQMETLKLDGRFQWPLPSKPAARPVRGASDTAPVDPPAPEDVVPMPDAAVPAVLKKPKALSARTGSNSQAGDPSHSDAKRRPASVAAPFTTEPPAAMLHMLTSLAQQSTVQKPLTITSILRAPYRSARFPTASVTNPHALGLAADITAFGGHRILTQNAEEAVQAFLALVKALPPGRYRMGVPKAPQPSAIHDAQPGAPDVASPVDEDSPAADVPRDLRHSLPSRGLRRQDDRRIANPQNTAGSNLPPGDDPAGTAQVPPPWPFFPAPRTQLDAHGKSITLFANEHYAQEEFLNDSRLRTALAEARRRGVDIFALFPDGENHIHVDVKQVP